MLDSSPGYGFLLRVDFPPITKINKTFIWMFRPLKEFFGFYQSVGL